MGIPIGTKASGWFAPNQLARSGHVRGIPGKTLLDTEQHGTS